MTDLEQRTFYRVLVNEGMDEESVSRILPVSTALFNVGPRDAASILAEVREAGFKDYTSHEIYHVLWVLEGCDFVKHDYCKGKYHLTEKGERAYDR